VAEPSHQKPVSRSSSITLSVVLVAVVSFVGALTAGASPATAAKLPISNLTCDAGGTLSFSPRLTPAGTPGSHEKIKFTETLTGCGGDPGTNLPSSPQSVKTKPIKLPATVVGGEKLVGDCQVLGTQLSQASSVKQTINWSKQFQKTGFNFVSRLMEEEGIYYFFEHDNGKHALITLGLASESSQALENCINGIGGPIASVSFDRTISSITEEGTVLTPGGVGGTKVAVGDLLSSGVVGGPNCTSANAQSEVESNPAVPGTAALQLTSLTFSNCTIDMGPGVGTLPAAAVVDNLPLLMSIGDGSGDPAGLGIMSLTISVNGGLASCSYASPAALTGTYDNGTSSVDFSGSVLAFTSGTGSLAANCPSSPFTAPSFTSVVDSSQSGSPAVFVN
jgi:Phage tail baseplate hub (GPD)